MRHHLTTVHTSAWTHINTEVRRTNHVFVMLNHQYAVTDVAQMFEGVDQSVVVALVQADAGFVQHVHHSSQARANLRRQANALRLSARQGVCTAVKA